MSSYPLSSPSPPVFNLSQHQGLFKWVSSLHQVKGILSLSQAHILAVKYLMNGGESNIFNLGNGVGFTVKEVIEVARKVTNHPIPAVIAERRAGDPAKLIASSAKAIEVLGWKPQYADLETIIASAWKWHSTHPNGYKK